MSKINILPAQVYNRIAAGEVVDRPYSVVKELVENAIDAGATEIEIYIERGGKQLVRVVDNGGGISRDDLHAAFLPHATSKIEKATDLEKILTLGFRGEAVASIAAVSKMTITSKEKGQKCYSLASDGGELGEITEAAGEDGTDVKVEMLFFNTPVRLDFLKSDKAEETDILNYVSRFILNRPEISFRVFADGKPVLQSFGGGEEEALASVYGASTLQNCHRIDADKHGVRIRGYIGNYNFYKPNKTYQSIFLNGRYIINTTISTAIASAYNNYLMKRQYPFYVLHIDVPAEIVDVNVHPNKADVRFADGRLIYGCIYNVVTAVLDGNAKALDYVDKTGLASSVLPAKSDSTGARKREEKPVASAGEFVRGAANEPIQTEQKKRASGNGLFELPQTEQKNGFSFSYNDALREMEQSVPAFSAKRRGENVPELPFDLSEPASSESACAEREEKAEEKPSYRSGMILIGDQLVKDAKLPKKARTLKEAYGDLSFDGHVLEVRDPNAANEPIDSFRAARAATSETAETLSTSEVAQSANVQKRANGTHLAEEDRDYFAENKRFLEEAEKRAKQNKIDVSSCRYAGKLFNTYLIYERADEFYLIDQHAAHERLIFNRLKEQMKNRRVLQQPMLLPYNLELNPAESAFIRDNLPAIREIGFEIEEFGGNAFKISAVPLDLQNINLANFFGDVLSDVSGYRAIRLEELLKDKLATAACKAAVKGGMDLTREEVDDLFRLMDGDMGLKCPHGRPVVVRVTKAQLEKMFKRIV